MCLKLTVAFQDLTELTVALEVLSLFCIDALCTSAARTIAN